MLSFHGRATLVVALLCLLHAGFDTFSFDIQDARLPLVTIVGGAQQTFSISAGINIQTAIDLASVCPGEWRGSKA